MSSEIRVLHVEDDAVFAETVQRLLTAEREEFEVVSERDAGAGLDRIAEGTVDCVVSDYDMPGTDGLEFLSAVREEYPDLPFILFTGKGSESVARDALREGATDYLRKEGLPDKVAVLANRVADAVEKRRTQRRLSEVQQRYRSLVETAPIPVAVHRDGVIRYANPAAVEFLGADDREEVRGLEVLELVHPGDRELARDHIEETLREGSSDPTEERIYDLDGNLHHLIVAASTTTYEGEPAVQVVGQEITERKARERALQRQRDRLSALFENVPDPAVSVRFEGEVPVVLDVNPEFEAAFGYDREDVVGESLDELIVPADRTEEATAFNERVRDGESLHAEVKRETVDGPREFLLSLVPYEAEDGTAGGFAIYTDVTDRRERERKLEALHEAARELMDAATTAEVAHAGVEAAREILEIPNGGVFLVDPEEEVLRPVAVTDGARQTFEAIPTLEAGESLGWEVYESGDPLVTDDVRDRENVANPETPVRSEIVVPLGEYGVLMAGSTTPGAFDDTDLSLLQVLAANVEAGLARAERETALRERRWQVERQNERLERFASVVSHDLRNPLERAQGYLEALDLDDPDPDYVAEIEEAHGRIEEIIAEVLTLARQGGEVEETVPVELPDAAREAWTVVDPPGMDLAVADSPTVLASESGIQQLLENLFRNAVEHADGASRVRVGSLPGGFLIEDDGAGIPEDRRDRVFDSDYSTDGTGLGLTIVEEIASAHGWVVSVADGSEGGARFEVSGVETPG